MRIVLLVGYWVALVVATHLPPRDVPNTGINDKLQHFAAYAILATLLVLTTRTRTMKGVIIAIAICLIYGALDEWTQPLVGRDCELLDWLADAIGAIVGAVVMFGASRVAAHRAAD
jgi:VanZ family protein